MMIKKKFTQSWIDANSEVISAFYQLHSDLITPCRILCIQFLHYLNFFQIDIKIPTDWIYLAQNNHEGVNYEYKIESTSVNVVVENVPLFLIDSLLIDCHVKPTRYILNISKLSTSFVRKYSSLK